MNRSSALDLIRREPLGHESFFCEESPILDGMVPVGRAQVDPHGAIFDSEYEVGGLITLIWVCDMYEVFVLSFTDSCYLQGQLL